MEEYINKMPQAKTITVMSLAYMYEYICDIIEYCSNNNYDFSEIRKDKMGAHGIMQCLANIGEHAKTIRDKDPDYIAFSDLPLHEMIGMRNRIEHQYKRIDWDIVSETILTSLPELKTFIEDNIQNDILEDPYILYKTTYADYITEHQ